MIERIEHEVWEGTGKLLCPGEEPVSVSYRFDVDSEIAGGQGLPPVLARRHAAGQIEALSGGGLVRDNDCQLQTTDRGTLRVRYVVGAWRILANP